MLDPLLGGASLSISHGSLQDIAAVAGELSLLPEQLVIATEVAVEATAEQLADHLTEEFQTHDRADLGRKRIEIDHQGMSAEVDMVNAGWVEYGTPFDDPGADITPKWSSVLHWVDSEGEHFAKKVKGIKLDDFVSVAIEKTSVETIADDLAASTLGNVLSKMHITETSI